MEKLGRRFGLGRIVLVVDRGMVTEANLDAIRDESGIAWISDLKAPAVKKLARKQLIQPSLFDELNLGEVGSDDYPGERLVVCRNPLVAAERRRTRDDLLAATEQLLAPIKARVAAGTLHGAAAIGLAVGAVANTRKVKKHFQLEIEDDRFTYQRKQEQIAAEAALDGIYVLRTSVPSEELSAGDIVRSYKQLAHAERAFRTLKGPELELRPIHHRLEARVRAHVFLCMLAYYLEWHLREAWAELLFDDERPPPARRPGRKGRTLARGQAESSKQTHHQGRGLPLLPQPDR